MDELRVLVPLDGSDFAEQVFGYLNILGQSSALSVHLLSVARHVSVLSNSSESESSLLTAYLKRQQVQLERDNVRVNWELRHGYPALSIVAAARDSRAHLILMSSHGRSGVDRFRLGSVTESVIATAPCSVLVIRASPLQHEDEPSLTPILVALDGSLTAEAALHPAARLAESLEGALHLARVVNGTRAGEAPYHARADFSSAHAYLTARFREVAPKQGTIAVLPGSPPEALLDYAAVNKTRLIAVTPHGHSNANPLSVGSVTAHLILGPNHVLVVRPESF